MVDKNEVIKNLKSAILNADFDTVSKITKEALNAGVEPMVMMKDAVSKGLNELHEDLYQDHKIWYTPALFLSYEAARRCLEILEPHIQTDETIGTVVLGTPAGDPHDVGAKWLAISLMVAGFKVIYLGRDVPSTLFVQKALETDAHIIAMSCHQTTGFKRIEEILSLMTEAGLRDKIKVMAGGSVITEKFAKKHNIGYAKGAPEAVQLACKYIGSKSA